MSKCVPKHVRLITCKHPTTHVISDHLFSHKDSLSLSCHCSDWSYETYFLHQFCSAQFSCLSHSLSVVCVCVCARARAHPRACMRTHVWVGGVLQHIISNSLYKSILLPYLLLNTCRTEWCMHCTHVFIWCCERAGFVW